MRAIIVSQQPICRGALSVVVRQALSADPIIIAGSLEDLPPGAAGADIALMDLPSGSGSAAWIKAAGAFPAKRRVLVVPERGLLTARLAHAHGFNGQMAKTLEPELMGAILRVVCAGGEYFPCFEEENQAAPLAPITGRLSNRQLEVLGLLREGQTNKEIAKALGISVATVKLHVQAILSVAGARNRTEAVNRLTSGQG